MSDIVERLRHFQWVFTRAQFPKAFHDMGDEIGQAADEIEQLRARMKDADKTISENNSLIGKMAAAIKNLKRAT